jgi:hypothetical protein
MNQDATTKVVTVTFRVLGQSVISVTVNIQPTLL